MSVWRVDARGRSLRSSAAVAVRVLIVAAEASADTYGARIVRALRRLEPGVEVAGIGGEQLRAAALARFAPARSLAIVGVTRVFVRLPHVVRLYRRMRRELEAHRPDVVLCIDLPEFNALLARRARKLGIPTLFFISPQFWAWRSGRLAKLAARVSKMVVAFPFEVPHYERAGIPVAFHGHPLLEGRAPAFATREAAAAHFGLDAARPIVILAPGSRRAEWRHHAQPLFAAAARIRAERPDVQFALPLAPHFREHEVEVAAREAGLSVACARDHTTDLLQLGDFGLLCSGTITLEAALAGLPMLIFYRVNWLNAALARRLIEIDRVGLPNIVLGGARPVFPEFLQEAVRAEALASEALAALGSAARLAELRAAAREVAERLQGGETSERVAQEVLALAGRGPAPPSLPIDR
jgi:lipid-A-disaccharide synthase